jgi:pimeloyl-ACP methyl ester carboxylesterase
MTASAVWAVTTGPVEAPHLVLIHGSLDRSAGMLKLSRRLDERFRVTRYDRRGYGKSMPHGGPFGIEHQVADLVGVIEGAGAGPALLFGHSYGGNVALATTQRRPDLVAGVVVYESPLSWMPWWPGTTAGADATAWGHDPAGAAERFMRHLIGDARWERLPPATRDARRSEGPALVGELIDLRSRPPWEAKQIEAPVLAMHGEHGQPHHHQAMEVMRAEFGCDVVTIAGARHFGPNTHPEPVAEAVVAFFERDVSGVAGG